MKKRFMKTKKAVFITVFCIVMTMAISGQPVSASAQPEPGLEGQSLQDGENADEKGLGEESTDEKKPVEENADEIGPVEESTDEKEPVEENADNENPGNENAESESLDNESQEQEKDEQPGNLPQVKAVLKEKKNTKAAVILWNGADGVQAYQIQRSKEENGKFKTIAVIEAGDANTAEQQYKDTGVKRGNGYFYRIVVQMEDGTVSYSNQVSFSCPLAKVSGVRLVRYSSSSIKAVWNPCKDKQAQYYKIYYANTESGDYELAGTTKNTWYRIDGLKNNRDYYFRVKACAAKKASGLDSALSETVKMRTVPYSRTTIFAGDSITVGLRTYNILSGMAIEGNKGIVAEVGLNTTTFRTRRIFDGKTGVESIIAAKPYRVYLMLGDNEIHYRSKEDTVAGYREILKKIQAGTPDTDIVVLAATPVTSEKVAERSGFAQIPAYNKSLKALAKSMGVRYFDCTDFLKDSSGCLKNSYSAGDGIHWTAEVYQEYARRLEAYDKSLD